MALTAAEFIEKSGAEVVCGKLIIGVQAERNVIGSLEPTFELNEEGQAIMAELEAGIAPVQAVEDAQAKKAARLPRKVAAAAAEPTPPSAAELAAQQAAAVAEAAAMGS
jgi:hypothetical protein